MAQNKYHGAVIHFGASSSTAFATGNFYTQSRDHNKKAEKEMIKDGDGNTVVWVAFDQNEEATFEYVPYTSGTPSGNLTPTLSNIGDLITVTDTVYTAIAGTNWIVDDLSTKSANNGAMRVTLKLVRFTNITS